MQTAVERIVLLPRFTALAGETTMYTAPVDVRRFAECYLVCWQSKGLGSGSGSRATFQIQESADLENWHDSGSAFPGGGWSAGEEWVEQISPVLPWIRVKVTLNGAVKGVSVWLAGEFVPRDTPGR